MDNKKIGMTLVVISLIFAAFILYFNYQLNRESIQLRCTPNERCEKIDQNISLTNIGFGFFGFMLGLGVYILFFNKTDEAILRRLEDEKESKIKEEKFDIVLKALDPYEKEVMKAVKEQDGITQNTLRLRVNMSKAKLSYVLTELEKRNLIKRVEKGKTLQIWLKI